MITHTLTHTTAIMFTHLYFLPRVHGPGANASPARQRRNTGIVYAMYSPITAIDVTARNATGVPAVFGKYAGIVITSAKTAMNSTDHVGVRFAPRRRQRLWPGTAPSRENANVIRDPLVMQAIPQNSCPITDMKMTAFAPSTLSEAVRIGRTVENPASALAPVLFTANVSASSTMYPTTAE